MNAIERGDPRHLLCTNFCSAAFDGPHTHRAILASLAWVAAAVVDMADTETERHVLEAFFIDAFETERAANR